jgi:hypothetical protein
VSDALFCFVFFIVWRILSFVESDIRRGLTWVLVLVLCVSVFWVQCSLVMLDSISFGFVFVLLGFVLQ